MDTDSLRHYYTDFGAVPDAPTFNPTDDEFRDPLAYIAKIRPIGEKYGIVKIRPPPSFQPPFVINLDTFKFTPRLQKLTDMEALSRVRVNFINKLANFWHLQGHVLKVPYVEGKVMNLYKLHKLVGSLGGFEACNEKQGAWSKISHQMGGKPVQGTLYKSHYKKILLPYDLSLRGDTVEHLTNKQNAVPLDRRSGQRSGRTLPPATAGGRMGMRSRQTPRELRTMQTKNTEQPPAPSLNTSADSGSHNTTADSLSDVLCNVCERGDREELLLLCDACDQSYHTYCLLPPLTHVPKGDWRCPKCVQQAVVKPTEAFGFEQAGRSFSLHSFGEMADRFKKQHFGRPVNVGCSSKKVSTAECEREFWSQLLDEEGRPAITVHYGADLLTSEVGSGFPRQKDAPHLQPCETPYITHPWNLNNVSVLDNSVLSHFNQRISGMMTPWIYIGMCFSAFCWHTEDHWSYSVNYHHWGQPKVWYGIPSSEADKFENGIKSIVPELFENQPDLMHHIVTIINPRVMTDEKGVKIFRIVQEPGDFVVTFPRGYHAGFNSGFNCAEAVNFCPADWIPFGRASVSHYALVGRYNVFAHDELICNMAEAAYNLEIPMAVTVYKDMINMVNAEKISRETLLAKGIKQTRRLLFEKLPDDDRACVVCKTTCYLSTLNCPCDKSRFVCLKHVDELCSACPSEKFTLHYRFTLPELVPLMKQLRDRTKAFDDWMVAVKQAFTLKADHRKTLDELRELADEAKERRYPACDTLTQLLSHIKQADRCKPLVEQLIANKIRTRQRPQSLVVKSRRLSLAEVHAFVDKLDKLYCRLEHTDTIKDFVAKVEQFQSEVRSLLSGLDEEALEDAHSAGQLHKQLQQMVETAIQFDLHMPELGQLKIASDKYSWLVAVDRLLPDDTKAEADTKEEEPVKQEAVDSEDEELQPVQVFVHQDRISSLVEQGLLYSGSGCQRRLASLQLWLDTAHNNTTLVNQLYADYQAPTKPPLQVAQTVKSKLSPLPHVKQPTVDTFVANVHRAEQWMQRYDAVMRNGATLSTLQSLESSARVVSFDIEQHKCNLQLTVAKLRALLQRIHDLFIKHPCYHSMSEMLMPRHDLYPLLEGQQCQLFLRSNSKGDDWQRVEEFESHKQMNESLERMAEQERTLMHRLRAHNKASSRAKICVCGQDNNESPTLTCDLCFERFHVDCVSWDACLERYPAELCVYVCWRCAKSARPPLSALTDQVDCVRWAGCVALEYQLLIHNMQRVKAWQDRARACLGAYSLASASGQPLGDSVRQQLEDVVVDGLLLELHTDELNELLPAYRAVVQPATEAQASCLAELRASHDTPSTAADAAVVDAEAEPKPAGIGASGSKRTSSSSLTASVASSSCSNVKRRRKAVPTSAAGGGSSSSAVVYHRDGELCAADCCLRPIGDSVNWIGCDAGCDKWYHILCVGLTVDAASRIDSYVCYKCTSKVDSQLDNRPAAVDGPQQQPVPPIRAN